MLDVQTLLLLILVAGGAGYDMTQRRVPNRLTVSMAAAGLAVNTYTGGLSGLGSAVLGALLGMALLIVPFAMGAMGAGDVKFLGAAGAVSGPMFVANGAILGFLWGGVLALLLLLARRRLWTTVMGMFVRFFAWIGGARESPAAAQPPGKMANEQLSIPYAVALGLGLLTVLAVEVLAPGGYLGGTYNPLGG